MASLPRPLVYNNPGQCDGVRVLGVDEHVWKHTARPGAPSNFVTVLVDLTAMVDGIGPARLVDMVLRPRADVLRRWLRARDDTFRARVQVVTMDGFTLFS